jgi:penicillin-binding protein 1A
MKWFFKIIKWLFFLGVLGVMVGALALGAVIMHYIQDLPKIEKLEDYRPSIITSVYADDDRKIAEFYTERRIVAPLAELPQNLINAFIASEDARFYEHKGIDVYGIIRAMLKNLAAGGIVQGGSTITQQVTKSFLLSPERSYRRKIKEAILAYRLDRQLTKDQILYLYLNQIYLGHGAYGVGAAAENYFGKAVNKLNLAECAMLAGLPQAPSRYSPFSNPESAKARQQYVLNRMVEEDYITQDLADQAAKTPINITPRRNFYMENAPYYAEYVRQKLIDMYGRDVIYNQGYDVYTCANIDMQKMADKASEKGLRDLDKRQGYRGPLEQLKANDIEAFLQTIESQLVLSPLQEGDIVKGVVADVDDTANTVFVRIGNQQGKIALKDMKWARKPNPEVHWSETTVYHPGEVLKKNDVILVRVIKKLEGQPDWDLALEQEPLVQSSLVCAEAETGEVKVMVGGRNFSESQFNRAVQSLRQPGSAFKPIIYAAALDRGFTPATTIVDSPIVFEDPESDSVWKPENYDEKFYGKTLFREGLIKSRNVVTVKLLQRIGVDYAIKYAKKLGITSKLERNLSLSLGASDVTLLELVNAYSVFANKGNLVAPCFIKRIVDRDGQVVYEHQPSRQQVIEESTAYVITHLMEEVVQFGTGWRVKALNRPVAGKTGTTNNLFDAWFVGYTPDYVTGVWVGFDDKKTIGKKETGASAASPIWLDFMQQAQEGKPVRDFEVPASVVFAKIDSETGLLPRPGSPAVFECFKEGSAPTEYTPDPGAMTETEDFFKDDIQ